MPKTGLQILESIRPVAPTRRFLQSWDTESRVLRFGCGDDSQGVQVGSDGSIDAAQVARPTKLSPETVNRFLAGATAQNPLADVQRILREYIHFSDDRFYTLFAVWIMGTYVYSVFSHFGYLFLHSATPRCGKTRAEEVTSHLAFEATTPRNAPTPPAMRETAVEGGTAIFDTLERWKEKGTESFAAAMELLDAGFRNGGVVAKMVSTGNGDWRQELYPVYAPYMFAAISEKSLTDTALDRSFVVSMVRKSTKLKTRPYDSRCEADCQPVRDNLYLTALTHAARISEIYESPALQEQVDDLGLNDRAADIWKPLLAISTAVDNRLATLELSALAIQMSSDPDRSEEKRRLVIIRALKTAAGPDGELNGTTQQIIENLRHVTTEDCRDLHALLTEWGFVERGTRLPGIDTPRRAWHLTWDDLTDVEQDIDPPPVPWELTTPLELPTTTTTVVIPPDPAPVADDVRVTAVAVATAVPNETEQ